MARKKQNIGIQIHIPEKVNSVFDREEVNLFWEGKVETLIRKSRIDKQELKA